VSTRKTTERQVLPLTLEASAGVLTATHGKLAVTKATEATLYTNIRGSVAADAHFPLIRSGGTEKPCRYIDVKYRATGTSAATVSTQVIVEFWDGYAWHCAEPFPAYGSTALLAATNFSVGEIRTIKVPRRAIAGRFYIPSLAANQGLDLVVDADNDD
jgi:hypothetical protein